MKKFFSFKNLNIARKFTVSFFLFLMFPLLLLFLWINSNVKERMTEENCKTNFAVLKQTKTSVDELIENLTYVSLQVIANEDLQTLFSSPDLTESQKSELLKSAKYDIGALLDSKEYITSLSVFNEEGIIIQFGKYLLDLPDSDLSLVESFGGRILWMPADICNEYAFDKDRTYENTITRAIINHDVYQQRLGFERISVEESYLCSLYASIAGEETQSMFIMNEAGDVVSSINKEMIGTSLADNRYFEKVKENREGYFFIDGGKNVVSFYYLPDPGWYVIKQDSKSELPGNGQPDLVIIMCIIIVIIFGIIFYGLQRKRIIKPLVQLAGDVEKFQEGHYTIGTYSESKDEIGKLNNSFVSMSRYIKDLIEKVYKSQLREKEAQLKYLQSQINPHFLYNTLDSMRWMAIKQKQYDLAEQIEALSNMFKHALNEGREFTSVDKEVRHLKDYMTIQKNRFGDRMKLEIDVESGTEKYSVLNLVLQPLVENSIVHGLESKLGEGKIEVRIFRKDNILIYSVKDNGLGTNPEIIRERLKKREDTHNAFALDNINQRVKCTYGEQYGIEFDSEIGKGTTVIVKMPVEGGIENEIADSR